MIDNGINELTRLQRESNLKLQGRAAVELWNKVHSFLKSMPGKTQQEHNEFCTRLESAPPETREGLIESEYGRLCLGRVQPLLYQLSALDRS